MAGILLQSGQAWVGTLINRQIISNGGLYIGLMTNTSIPSETGQLPTQIVELSPAPACSGYTRQLCTPFTYYSGIDPYLQGTETTFLVTGDWNSVYGYFVSLDNTGNSALWAELFPVGKRGDKHDGDEIKVTPIYEQKYDTEA
jgi:hypothetical protein